MTAKTAQRVLSIALSHAGYMECRDVGHSHRDRNHTKFGRDYGLDGEPWCAMFVSACHVEAGFPLHVSTSKGYAYTPAGVAYFKKLRRWFDSPEPGDHGFLYYPSLGRVGHVFLVVEVDGDHVITCEGNTNAAGGREGGVVAVKRRRIADVHGFGRPLWPADTPPRPPTPTPQPEEDEMLLIREKGTDKVYVVGAVAGHKVWVPSGAELEQAFGGLDAWKKIRDVDPGHFLLKLPEKVL